MTPPVHSPPKAIRSLQCPDHAYHVVPSVLSVTWMIGKRCNYDCSYCSPHQHDAVSPFMDLAAAQRFVDAAEQHCVDHGNRIKWAFTGGEPFLDPGFMLLSEYIADNACTEQLNVVTNGGLPRDVYERASRIFKGITVSLHLERPQPEIDEILDKCLQMQHNCFVSVNAMFLPGRSAQIQTIAQRLNDSGVPFVVRKITPPLSQSDFLPYQRQGPGRKEVRLHDLAQQRTHKILWKDRTNSQRKHNLMQYYTDRELGLLQDLNRSSPWQNCGVWFADGSYRELNTDYLLARDLVDFQGWLCYAGVDSLYVDFDGSVYRATCLNDPPLGHIGQGVVFAKNPTRCKKTCCTCNTDIATRKAAPDYLNHVQD
jgi:molybdenum cofactor biosynthesis enzyme MoaA